MSRHWWCSQQQPRSLGTFESSYYSGWEFPPVLGDLGAVDPEVLRNLRTSGQEAPSEVQISMELVKKAKRIGKWVSTNVKTHSQDFVLAPLLSLLVRGSCLFVGPPGLGKTTIARIMAIVGGVQHKDMVRLVVHGHPELTVTDLLGAPLPANLMKATTPDKVVVQWADWLHAPVKIVDEYNRIPTKTQSALLSLLAEGEAAMLGQHFKLSPAAWYLTANEASGGGTFNVIEALKDRIDIAVVAGTPADDEAIFASEKGRDFSREVPEDVKFSPGELNRILVEIGSIPVSRDVIEAFGFMTSMLDFCQQASNNVLSMSKKHLTLTGGIQGARARTVADVCNENCPLPKKAGDANAGSDISVATGNICTQTMYGTSTRAKQVTAIYVRALAWLKGQKEAGLEELRHMLPLILRERLQVNPRSAFWEQNASDVEVRLAKERLLSDRSAWIDYMFQQSEGLREQAGKAQKKVAALAEKVATALADRDETKLAEASTEIDLVMEQLGSNPTGEAKERSKIEAATQIHRLALLELKAKIAQKDIFA